MRNTFLPFSKPLINDEEIAAVAEVLRSGWITTGPKTTEFEERFSRFCGISGAVAMSSATGCMHVLLTAMNIGPGDEVITPSMTWVSTVNLIKLAGATPVFVDVDRDSLMTSAELIEPLVTDRTRLIVPVHFAGATADMTPIRALAAKRSIALVEDAAHAVGSEYLGEKIGHSGTSIFSFHPIKNMTTGEGGMFCSNDSNLLQAIRRLKFHGLDVDAHDRGQQGRAPQSQVLEPGYKYNMTDIAAVLGLGQLARLDSFIDRRAVLARRYLELLAEIDEISPLVAPSWTTRHSWHLFIVRLDTDKAGMDRNQFMEGLKQRNIGTGIHFIAVHEQKFYQQSMQVAPGSLAATEWNSKRICSLPLFPAMTIEDVDDVVSAIKDVLSR